MHATCHTHLINYLYLGLFCWEWRTFLFCCGLLMDITVPVIGNYRWVVQLSRLINWWCIYWHGYLKLVDVFRCLRTKFVVVSGVWEQSSLSYRVFENKVHCRTGCLRTKFITISSIWELSSLLHRVFKNSFHCCTECCEQKVHYRTRCFRTQHSS
jgi:hypothetical protein